MLTMTLPQLRVKLAVEKAIICNNCIETEKSILKIIEIFDKGNKVCLQCDSFENKTINFSNCEGAKVNITYMC